MEEGATYNITVENGVKTVEILTGKALPRVEPLAIFISGTIDSVRRYLERRINEIDQQKSHVLVDRDCMTITFRENENSPYGNTVIGSLQLHPDFEKFKINTGQEWSPRDLSNFIKMNRSAFTSKETAMDLSSNLLNLKVKVERELEKTDNNRGDVQAMVRQKVIRNSIPEGFKLFVQVFKGQARKEISVEIYINPDTYCVSLVSPDANDIISETKNSLIDTELSHIDETCPDLVIIEQ